jgi:hypothetical protein
MSINVIAMALMPISQGVSWYFVLSNATGTPLYPTVCGIASFYCAWALYNRYLAGVVQELGQYSMGAAALATYFQHRPLSMAATGLVLFNFVAPGYLIVWKWSVRELAKNVKQDTSALGMVWARIFKLYFVSNIALWCTILYKFYHTNQSSSRLYQQLPITS